jgi:hypothetical protein
MCEKMNENCERDISSSLLKTLQKVGAAPQVVSWFAGGTPPLHARSLFFMRCTSAGKQADSQNFLSSRFSCICKLF